MWVFPGILSIVKYPHKQNIARITASTASLRAARRVIILRTNVPSHADFVAAALAVLRTDSCLWFDTPLLS